MGNEKSLAHTRWNCKYHIVFAPKYRRQVFYREKRRAIGCILRKLCEWKSVQILEAEYCANPAPNERIRKCSALVLPYSFMGRLFISVSKSQKRTFNVSIR